MLVLFVFHILQVISKHLHSIQVISQSCFFILSLLFQVISQSISNCIHSFSIPLSMVFILSLLFLVISQSISNCIQFFLYSFINGNRFLSFQIALKKAEGRNNSIKRPNRLVFEVDSAPIQKYRRPNRLRLKAESTSLKSRTDLFLARPNRLKAETTCYQYVYSYRQNTVNFRQLQPPIAITG